MRSKVPRAAAAALVMALAAWRQQPPAAPAPRSPAARSASPVDPCYDPGAAITLGSKSCDADNPSDSPSPAPARSDSPQVSCYLPAEVEGGLAQPNLNARQRAADLFAWQEAIALDWPASPASRGQADRGRKLADPGPRVWETWKEEKEVYLPGGVPPPAWDAPSPIPIPAECRGIAKLLFRRQKIDDGVDSLIQAVAADGTLPATLTDQKKKLVRYEIRLNRPLFEAIVANRWYDGRRQAEAAAVSFPAGSMMVKAAWRELAPEEEPLFRTADACVCDEPEGIAAGSARACRAARVGLVGLHVAHKTASAPRWVWATFEQANNVASAGGAPPSFFAPDCNPLRCPVNRQTPPGTPNQLARATPIPSAEPRCSAAQASVDNVRQLNDDVAAALAAAGSVLANYRLVGAQWPLAPAAVRPPILANTTMESFVQGTSSCLGCHATARTTNPDRFVPADFSFTLNNALPKPATSRILAPPVRAKTPWDAAHWPEVERGRALAVDTYRLLPAAVGAKLHCASCHLAAGGDPDAAWWVGMRRAYATEDALADRINQCFEHSLNGKAICAAATPRPEQPGKAGQPVTSGKAGRGSRAELMPCGRASDMKALIAYMDWLTEQWQATHGGEPPRGYPPLAASAGDPARGAEVYVQKCAVCHNAHGEGRYEHDTYFRPALWGPASFNACAGMAKAATLAAFAHAGMPLGAGGALAPQEAADVAAYVDRQCRPGLGKDAQGRLCPASAHCAEGHPTPGADIPSRKPWIIPAPPP
jgi:cytochrome c